MHFTTLWYLTPILILLIVISSFCTYLYGPMVDDKPTRIYHFLMTSIVWTGITLLSGLVSGAISIRAKI